jgi:hypothetical protein
MPFVPTGKKKQKLRQREAEERIFDRAIGAARGAVVGAGLCLPMCVLLVRILDAVRPGHGFSVRLGALHVVPQKESEEPILFDPRSPEGIDGGVHAWLEDWNARLLDPAIFVTLHSHGFAVDPRAYLIATRRRFADSGLLFVYEELPELELLGLHESETALRDLFRLAMTGVPPQSRALDVGWKAGVTPPTLSMDEQPEVDAETTSPRPTRSSTPPKP